MRSQPKHARLSEKNVGRPAYDPQVLYRELCQDQDGKRYTVIVYRPFADLNVTRYELDDGTPVRFIDDCVFEIEATDTQLTRCP